mmetsp:Transcript_36688/g.104858  ORF Transcript_36688/g.104858 Transcript_36688/m.104858 type:complete len:301 (-) Transcript_36688:361-1263(-)
MRDADCPLDERHASHDAATSFCGPLHGVDARHSRLLFEAHLHLLSDAGHCLGLQEEQRRRVERDALRQHTTCEVVLHVAQECLCLLWVQGAPDLQAALVMLFSALQRCHDGGSLLQICKLLHDDRGDVGSRFLDLRGRRARRRGQGAHGRGRQAAAEQRGAPRRQVDAVPVPDPVRSVRNRRRHEARRVHEGHAGARSQVAGPPLEQPRHSVPPRAEEPRLQVLWALQGRQRQCGHAEAVADLVERSQVVEDVVGVARRLCNVRCPCRYDNEVVARLGLGCNPSKSFANGATNIDDVVAV